MCSTSLQEHSSARVPYNQHVGFRHLPVTTEAGIPRVHLPGGGGGQSTTDQPRQHAAQAPTLTAAS